MEVNVQQKLIKDNELSTPLHHNQQKLLSCIKARVDVIQSYEATDEAKRAFGVSPCLLSSNNCTAHPSTFIIPPGRVYFFWTHFRLSLFTAVHMRIRSATPSAYFDL